MQFPFSNQWYRTGRTTPFQMDIKSKKSTQLVLNYVDIFQKNQIPKGTRIKACSTSQSSKIWNLLVFPKGFYIIRLC